MTAIISGDGSTLTAETAEGRLIECLTLMKMWESSSNNNPQNITNITALSFSAADKRCTASFTIPTTVTNSGDGKPTLTAITYLQNTGFNPGNESTFKSASIEGYLLEICTYLQILESNPNKNRDNQNNVTIDYNFDDATITGSIDMPILIEINSDGSTKITADEYLLD